MAIKVIPPGKEKSFLKTLPIREMWGIGPKSEKLLQDFGIVSIGSIQRIQIEKLEKILGSFAYTLKRRALGIDNRQVGNDESVKSISNERTFFDNLIKKKEIYSVIKDLSEKVGFVWENYPNENPLAKFRYDHTPAHAESTYQP